jgi:drug/metabolite transporter (DMT)-like permease
MDLPWNRCDPATLSPAPGSIANGKGPAVCALIAANVIWGASFVATKPVLEAVPPATLSVIRLLVALAVLLPALRLTGRAPSLGIGPALLGVTGVTLVFLLQNMGLQRTSAANAAILQCCVPVITTALAFLLLRESLPAVRVLAMAVSVAGALLVVAVDAGANSSMSPIGDGLILCSSIALACYFVLGRKLFAEQGALSLVAGASVYGLAALLPASIYEFSQERVSAPEGADWLLLVYLGAGASALAYCLEGQGLCSLGAGQVSLFANIGPVVGVGGAALVLGEALSASQLIGGVLVLVGAWLTMRRPGRVRRSTPAPEQACKQRELAHG